MRGGEKTKVCITRSEAKSRMLTLSQSFPAACACTIPWRASKLLLSCVWSDGIHFDETFAHRIAFSLEPAYQPRERDDGWGAMIMKCLVGNRRSLIPKRIIAGTAYQLTMPQSLTRSAEMHRNAESSLHTQPQTMTSRGATVQQQNVIRSQKHVRFWSSSLELSGYGLITHKTIQSSVLIYGGANLPNTRQSLMLITLHLSTQGLTPRLRIEIVVQGGFSYVLF